MLIYKLKCIMFCAHKLFATHSIGPMYLVKVLFSTERLYINMTAQYAVYMSLGQKYMAFIFLSFFIRLLSVCFFILNFSAVYTSFIKGLYSTTITNFQFFFKFCVFFLPQ